MKKILLSLMLSFILIGNTFAHPGRLDSYGGHSCYTNCWEYGLYYGEYHYHPIVNGIYDYNTSTSQVYSVNTQNYSVTCPIDFNFKEYDEVNKLYLENEDKLFNLEDDVSNELSGSLPSSINSEILKRKKLLIDEQKLIFNALQRLEREKYACDKQEIENKIIDYTLWNNTISNAELLVGEKQYDSAIMEYTTLFDIERFKGTEEIGEVKEYIGELYILKSYNLYLNSDKKNSIIGYKKALEYVNNVEKRFNVYKTIAIIYSNMGDYKNSIKYYNQAKNYALYSDNDIIASTESIKELNDSLDLLKNKIKNDNINNVQENKYIEKFRVSLGLKLEKLSTKQLMQLEKKIDIVLHENISNDIKLKLEALKILLIDILENR